MTIRVEATYENGVLRLEAPLNLREKAKVTLTIEAEPETKADDDDPTGWRAIDRLIGSVRSGLADVSQKHDDYLYGDPRD